MADEQIKSVKITIEDFPPELEGWEKGLLRTVNILAVGSLAYIIYWFWARQLGCTSEVVYLSIGLILIALVVNNWIRHRFRFHKARRADIGSVKSMFVEAEFVKPRIEQEGKPKKPENYTTLEAELIKEVKRLEDLGNKGWIEYQILPLIQMLVDFLKIDDLKSYARHRLEELKDYAEDNAYSYYWENYYSREQRIERAIEQIDSKRDELVKGLSNNDSDRLTIETEVDESAKPLRAEVQSLLEHIADLEMNWAEGSAIVRGITIIGVLGIPILLFGGLLPALDHCQDVCLRIINWGFLGMVGSMTAVLLGLRKSDLVEVGNTKGKQELWKAVQAAALGLVAGVLIYSAISGEILMPGGVVPNICDGTWKDLGLSTIWAFTAGLVFEDVFERLRLSTIGGN